jgi:hypothetical protein
MQKHKPTIFDAIRLGLAESGIPIEAARFRFEKIRTQKRVRKTDREWLRFAEGLAALEDPRP